MATGDIEYINGSRVLETFVILHEGWEMDNQGFILEDGTVWTTSHGKLYQMEVGEAVENIKELSTSLAGWSRALEVLLAKPE